jgi:rhamnogalacturonan endolyase
VVGLSNANAQYWARADGSGRFALTGVRPGHYRLTLYQGELEVAQSTVDINADATTHARVQASISLAARPMLLCFLLWFLSFLYC